MKILLTGSSGFIGKNLEKALQEKFPGEEIVSLKRKGKSSASELSDNCSYIDYSDIDTLLDCKDCASVDLAFHLAGVTREVSFERFYQANVMPTKNLLDALKQKSPNLERFIFTSSHAASGPSKNRQHKKTESEEDNPVEYYGESKWMAEQVVKDYHSILPCTILRPGSVYGPWDPDFLNIFKMAKSGINVYAGNKKKFTSIIYIDDLVDGMISASLSGSTIAKNYFMCNDEPVSWQQIHETIFKAMGKEPFNISIPFPFIKALSYLGDAYANLSGKCSLLNVQKVKLSEPYFWIASNENAKKDFGYSPQVSLDEGIRLTYDYYRANKQL
ncbi:MAG TPA: NAD(P)-dependent oxidoreductase [Candidatus Nanoarchaeia archaeon]|nr:NAD(P)-dependent oxidoreductase [Candidatus Nanoarchaeia archaeon]